ncbi:MAG: hypothetical protein SFV32_09015 [Opitutaceae bacterium]|nr:hypothetical protein [Opitutaceae bacterium]
MIHSRLNRFAATLILLLSCLPLHAAPALAGRTDEEEAKRLFERAEAYVLNISEGEYSYGYLQFYWKRAQANFDRIVRVYPETAVAKSILSGDAKLGHFEPEYFRDRVLPRVEVKKLGAYDAVNCAILLQNLDQSRWDQRRLLAQDKIIEVLARQQRWNEALIFPVRNQEATRKLLTVYRIAAHFDQPKVTARLREKADPQLLAQFASLDAEGIVYLGKPRELLDTLLKENASREVALAALRAIITRELLIENPPLKLSESTKGITTTHFALLNLEVRDNVRAFALKHFPPDDPQVAGELERWVAGQGREPRSNATHAVQAEYLTYLVRKRLFKEAESFLLQSGTHPALDLRKMHIRRLAEAGEAGQARALLGTLALSGAAADDAEFELFSGVMESFQVRLAVHPGTFADIPISDPCLLAAIIMDWSLTPNRLIRGAAPWDAVVFKYLPGFENLPLPESDEVGKAAAILKPY